MTTKEFAQATDTVLGIEKMEPSDKPILVKVCKGVTKGEMVVVSCGTVNKGGK